MPSIDGIQELQNTREEGYRYINLFCDTEENISVSKPIAGYEYCRCYNFNVIIVKSSKVMH
jgi:hypothetical protein